MIPARSDAYPSAQRAQRSHSRRVRVTTTAASAAPATAG
jgi:hypothetical protein